MLREAVAGLEAARARRGFHDSLLRDGPPQVNERYTARLQALKKHARAAISLTPRTRRPSNALADLVGMVVAAVAMAFATFTVYLAQRQGPQFGESQLFGVEGPGVSKRKRRNSPLSSSFSFSSQIPTGVVYVMILVGGYVVKGKSEYYFFFFFRERKKENAEREREFFSHSFFRSLPLSRSLFLSKHNETHTQQIASRSGASATLPLSPPSSPSPYTTAASRSSTAAASSSAASASW